MLKVRLVLCVDVMVYEQRRGWHSLCWSTLAALEEPSICGPCRSEESVGVSSKTTRLEAQRRYLSHL